MSSEKWVWEEDDSQCRLQRGVAFNTVKLRSVKLTLQDHSLTVKLGHGYMECLISCFLYTFAFSHLSYLWATLPMCMLRPPDEMNLFFFFSSLSLATLSMMVKVKFSMVKLMFRSNGKYNLSNYFKLREGCCLEFFLIRKAKGSPLFSYIQSAMKFLKGQFFFFFCPDYYIAVYYLHMPPWF